MATWGVNYGVVGAMGLGLALLMDSTVGITMGQAIFFIFLPMPLASLLFARHAKALYLAMDHYFDPHRKH
jgi:hypothetical protein